MNNERFYFLLTEYLNNQIDEELIPELKAELIRRGENANDLESLRELTISIENWEIPKPSERLKDNFYSLLASEKPNTMHRGLSDFSLSEIVHKILISIWAPKMAYALVLLLLGFIAGQFFSPATRQNEQISTLSAEVNQMREVMMLALLNDPTAAGRLKAIHTTQYLPDPDEKIIQALLKTLNSDPNENVRLAAVDALLMYSAKDEVRQGLVGSIQKQHSPMIQIALIDGMLAMNEKNAKPALQQLLQRKQLNPLVKTRIEQTIKKIS